MPNLTLDEIAALMDRGFPEWRSFSDLVAIGERDLTLRMPFRKQLLRAGGTISGPAMMAFADTSAYMLLLAQVGPGAASAATANLDIHFLARPQPVDMIAVATMLRLGRRLAVSTVDIQSEGVLVAHATVTYAVPPGA